MEALKVGECVQLPISKSCLLRA